MSAKENVNKKYAILGLIVFVVVIAVGMVVMTRPDGTNTLSSKKDFVYVNQGYHGSQSEYPFRDLGQGEIETWIRIDSLVEIRKRLHQGDRADLNSIDNLLAQVETKEECEDFDTWPAKCTARFDMFLYDEQVLDAALDTMTSIIENRCLTGDEAHVAIELSDFLEFTLHDAVHDSLDYFTAEEFENLIVQEYKEYCEDESQFPALENNNYEMENNEDERDNIFLGLTL